MWHLRVPSFMGLRWCARSGGVKRALPSTTRSGIGGRRSGPPVPAARSTSGSRTTSSSGTRASPPTRTTSSEAPVGKVRRGIAKQSRGQRRQNRAGLLQDSDRYLHDQAVRPPTREVYRHAASEAAAWASAQGLDLSNQLARDATMTRYIHVLYFAGEGAFSARVAVYGLAHQMQLNLKDTAELCRSRRALKGFSVSAPDAQRDPLPWEGVVLIASWLLDQENQQDVAMARAMVVAFDGYFRPSEVLGIRGCDITIARKALLSRIPPATVRLAPSAADRGDLPNPRTKSGSYDDTVSFGDDASTAAGRRFVVDLLTGLKKAHAPNARVFPVTLAAFEARFRDAVAALNLKMLCVSPHCLRHGGASSDYAASHRGLSDVQRRGRWLAQASVRRYEKTGRLAAQISRLDGAQIRSAKAASASLPARLREGL